MVLELAEGASLAFRWCPPGTFVMGSSETEPGRENGEGPQTTVTLTHGFWMAETEVTQAQWRAVMGTDPSDSAGDDLPVERVTWHGAMKFCERLSASTSRTLTLPTEAQWEYACRAESTTAYHSGETEEDLAGTGWHGGNADGKTRPVAMKSANAWGLFDMHGNVWEWCLDGNADVLPGGSVTDPTGVPTSVGEVNRRGSRRTPPRLLRPASRSGNLPTSATMISASPIPAPNDDSRSPNTLNRGPCDSRTRGRTVSCAPTTVTSELLPRDRSKSGDRHIRTFDKITQRVAKLSTAWPPPKICDKLKRRRHLLIPLQNLTPADVTEGTQSWFP
jgi:hypothetical protein